MKSLFFALLVLAFSFNAFGARTCKQIQKNCDELKVSYAKNIKSWSSLSYKTMPPDVLDAENKWFACLLTKKENGCFKK